MFTFFDRKIPWLGFLCPNFWEVPGVPGDEPARCPRPTMLLGLWMKKKPAAMTRDFL